MSNIVMCNSSCLAIAALSALVMIATPCAAAESGNFYATAYLGYIDPSAVAM